MSALSWKLEADDRQLLESLKRSVEGFKSLDRHARDAGANASKSGSDMDSSFGKLSKWVVGGGLVAGVGMLAGKFNALTGEFARMGDLADRLEMTGESVQRLSYIAQQGGTDIEVMAKSLTKMTAALNSGGPQAEKMREALGGLGINAEQFVKLSPEEKLMELSRGFEASGGDGEAFSKTLDLVGLRAADLIPTLRMGSDALREMAANAPVISDSALDGIKKYDDAVQRMTGSLKAAVAQSSAFQYTTKYLGTIADMISGKSLGQAVEANFMAPNGETDASRLVAELNAKQAAASQYGGASLKASGLLATASSDEHRRKVNEVMAESAKKAAAEQAKADAKAAKEKSAADEAYKRELAMQEERLADATTNAEKSRGIADAMNRMDYNRSMAMKYVGDPMAFGIATEADAMLQETGVDPATAAAMAREGAAVEAYGAKLQGTRRNMVKAAREQRRLEREGRTAVRAKNYAERKLDDSIMKSRPIGEMMGEAVERNERFGRILSDAEKGAQLAEDIRRQEQERAKEMASKLPENVDAIRRAIGEDETTVTAGIAKLNERWKEIMAL